MNPIIIGHRGAAGYLPEHTLEGYQLAIQMGADFIEPDVVSTSDGVLIVRHEPDISETTDVSVKFPERKTTKIIDGKPVTGYFTDDFTYDEIKTLRARERLPFRDHQYDDQFAIPTLEEVIQLAKEYNVGIYPETKHPTYFRQLGLPLEEKLLALLDKYDLNRRDAPVYIQSFEVQNLKDLRKRTPVKLVQLIEDVEDAQQPYDFVVSGNPKTYLDMMTPAGLKEIATYADAIGPYKRYIVTVNPDNTLGHPTNLIRDAHRVGLQVHPWTFRYEDQYLPNEFKGNFMEELKLFWDLGVDGLFTDFPDLARIARWQWCEEQK